MTRILHNTRLINCGLLLLLVLSINSAVAQKCMTFSQAQKAGIFESLDQTYKGGLNSDTTRALFKDPQAYITAYQGFITGLALFLKEHQFKWGKPVRCFNKIYFSPAGRVQYFLYNFKPGELAPAQEKAFARLLGTYIKTAQFGLPSTAPFAQCSPVS
ncbi:hypothetical protein JYG30_20110 [Fibrella sp. USSR17]